MEEEEGSYQVYIKDNIQRGNIEEEIDEIEERRRQIASPCGGKGAAPRSSILHLNLRPSPLKPLSL